MSHRLFRHGTSLLALLVAGALAAEQPSIVQRRQSLPARTGPKKLSGHDRADLRRQWELYWFGGQPSADYLDFKRQAAQEEIRRWGHLFPGGTPMPAIPGNSVSWVNLGPTANVTDAGWPAIDSGRPVSIVTHPSNAQTLYMATSGGGVFKCVNADPTSASDWVWTNITDALPASSGSGNVACGALAMDPTAPETLYLGLGDAFDAQGRGLYKTTNGGTTWTECGSLGATTNINEILVLDATTLLVAGNAGVYRSTNGGTSFTQVVSGGVAWSVQQFSATELICSIEAGSKIYYSSNAGATWTGATLDSSVTALTPGRITLASSAASGTTAWGIAETGSATVSRGLLKTIDKGHTWTFVAAPVVTGGLFKGTGPSMSTDGGQGWYNHGLAVSPADINRVFVGANLALYRTLDGGANWAQMSHWYGSAHPYQHADNHTTAWSKTGTPYLYVGHDGGISIYKDPFGTIPTADLASAFVDNRRNKGLATHLVYSIGSTNATTPVGSKDRVTLGLQDNGTRMRMPSGGNLAGSGIFEDQIGGDGFGTVIHPTDGDKILGSLYYTRIFRTTDGGATAWSEASSILEANDQNAAPFAPKIALGAAAEPNTVYTFVNKKVYKSTDFGNLWIAMGMTGFDDVNRIIRNVGASRSNANAVAVVTSGGTGFVTYNGGTSWAQFGAIPNNGLSMSYVWFDTTNANTLYASSVALGSSLSHLWKSTNSGATWTAIDVAAGGGSNGFPSGIPVHVIQNDPAVGNTLLAGTDFGVYRSTDGGLNWSRYGQNLPMVAVRDLYIAPDGSFVRAATFGRGAWELVAPVGPTVTIAETGPLQVAPSGTASLHASVTNATNTNVNWTAPQGSFSPTTTASAAATTWTAPATPQVVTLTATSAENSSGTATITANVYTPGSVSVTVAPNPNVTPAIVITGGSLTFGATVTNAPTTSVTWSVNGGSISGGGVFTAPNLATGTQVVTVTATSIYAGTTPGTTTVTVKSIDLNADATVDFKDMAALAKAHGTVDAARKLTSGSTAVGDADVTAFLSKF